MSENYMETLRIINVGEICMYELKHALMYQGFKMAKSRLKNKNYMFKFELTEDKLFLKITRIS